MILVLNLIYIMRIGSYISMQKNYRHGEEHGSAKWGDASNGMRGNYTKNDQQTGRELMPADEVRMLDNQYAFLFIRGERPVKDFKFDILRHPNVSLAENGKGKPYIHGYTSGAAFTIELTNELLPNEDTEPVETGYILLSEEDVEKSFTDQNEQVQKMR